MGDVKAVLWDIGNVLVSFENRQDVLCRIARRFSSDGTPNISCFSGLFGRSLLGYLDTGQISHRALWKMTCLSARIHPRKLPWHRFTALYVEHLRPVLPVLEVVRRIQESYIVVAVSDGDFGSTYAIDMRETHYGVRFQKRFESWQVGVKKPSLYTCALNYLESSHVIHADEVVCIDDIASYIGAANRIGMRGILFNAITELPQVLITRLAQNGVHV